MDEHAWLTSSDPAAMLRLLTAGFNPKEGINGRACCTNRKLRLLSCACRRLEPQWPWVKGDDWMEMEDDDASSINNVYLFIGGQSSSESQELCSKQASLLRCIFGNPWRQINVSCPECKGSGTSTEFHESHASEEIICPVCMSNRPQWLTPTVVSLARAIYEGRDWPAMQMLADALEEAGMSNVKCDECSGGIVPCGNDSAGGVIYMACPNCYGTSTVPHPILAHLRPQRVKCDINHAGAICTLCNGTGFRAVEPVHARGCWVLDLILGKT